MGAGHERPASEGREDNLSSGAANGMNCPVCPYQEVPGDALECPSCGTDVAAVRRVRELPFAILNDGIRLAKQRKINSAMALFQAAAALPQTRGRSLILLGKCEAQKGHLRAALKHWKAAAANGQAQIARVCQQKAERLRTEKKLRGSAESVACPNPRCRQREKKDSRGVVLVRVYGPFHTPLWRCRLCRKA